jgi:hypothetical protein
MKGKLQLLFTFLFYLSYNPDEAATSFSSAPIEWKLQLPDVQAPTCTGDFYSLPFLLPTTLESFSVTKNLQTNSYLLCQILRINFSPQILQSHLSSIILSPHLFSSLSLYNFISDLSSFTKMNLTLGLRLYH